MPWRFIGLWVVLLNVAWGTSGDENIVFPPDAGVIDVTKPPYNAVPDGKTDCTRAIQQALSDFPGRGIIYLPNGTYIISDTLRWMHGEKRNILQGQSRSGTIIKLKDNAPGFNDPTQPRAMIWTGRKPAQRFRNGLRNLTIDTGKGNPGAIGAQFIANNQGGIHYVTIRSGDGSGPIGLDLAYTPEEGPFLVTHLLVEGFDVGIANSCPVDSVTFENLTLENQRRLGIDIDSQVINIRKMKTRLSVPVVKNYGVAVTTIVESEFHGEGGAADFPAITNANSSVLFLRDVKASGYARLVDNESGTRQGVQSLEVKEYTSHPPHILFPSMPRSLNLPVKETPVVPYDDPSQWTSILKYGPPKMIKLVREVDGKAHMAMDWSEAMQRAIDDGATTLYFPNRAADQTQIPKASSMMGSEESDEGTEGEVDGQESDEISEGKPKQAAAEGKGKKGKRTSQDDANDHEEAGSDRVVVDGKSLKVNSGPSYGIYGTVYLRNKIRRVIGMESDLDRIVNDTVQRTAYQPELVPKFVLEDGEAPVVVFERFNTWYGAPEFEQRSKRTLVISSMSFFRTVTTPGSGDVFLHDVRAKHIAANGSNIWGRQINPEGWQEPRILVDGGMFWVFGLKTETDATIGIVRNGGRAEVVGGFFYANKNKINPKVMWVNEDSDLSFNFGSWKTRGGRAFDVVVRETRGGTTREVRHEDAIPRGQASALALYTGSKPKGVSQPTAVKAVQAKSQGSAAVEIAWQGPVTGADGIAIEQREADGSYKLVRIVPPENTQAVIKNLSAGTTYAFRVKAYSGVGETESPVVEATTDAAAPAGTGTGLQAEYFAGLDFEDRKAQRIDPTIDFEWGQQPPVEGLKPERFSVRWTGAVEPRFTEPYTFSIQSNFGARLFVNDELIADTLNEYDRQAQHGTVNLKAGEKARIRVEYNKRESAGLVKLQWKSPNTPAEPIPTTQLYPEFTELPRVGFSKDAFEVKENHGAVRLKVSRSGASNAEILTVPLQAAGDAVSGLHYKPIPESITIPAGQDSAELVVEILDNPKGEPDRALLLLVGPDPGQLPTKSRCTIRIADDDMPPPGNGTGWQAEFFQGAEFENFVGAKILGRSDFYWDKKAPHPDIDTKKPYSMRWQAELLPLFSEPYQFTLGVGGSGGARLYINNNLVIDNWTRKGVNSAVVNMKAGERVLVKVEMRQEKFYGALLNLQWSSPSQYLQPIPASQLFPTPPTTKPNSTSP